MTIDIKELRILTQDFKLAGSPMFLQTGQMNELLDRLEAAEKAVTEAYQRGYETGQEEITEELEFAKREVANLHDDISELTDERDALRAKITEMERQEPVAWTTRLALESVGRGTLGFHACGGNLWGEKGAPLYAIPGAQPAPTEPDATVLLRRAAMAMEVVGTEWRESDPTLRLDLASALAAAPEAKP